jgi:hypothetical protein
MKYHEGSSFSLQCQYVEACNAGQRGHADGEVVDGRCVWTQGRSLVGFLVGKGTKLVIRSGYSDARELDL